MATALKGAILFVRDMEKMTAFYRDVVGLTQTESEYGVDVWVPFEDDGSMLGLLAIPAEHRDGAEAPEALEPRASTPIKLVFRVDDLTSKCEEMLDAGANPLRFVPEHGRADYVDPEGNIFQLTDL